MYYHDYEFIPRPSRFIPLITVQLLSEIQLSSQLRVHVRYNVIGIVNTVGSLLCIQSQTVIYMCHVERKSDAALPPNHNRAAEPSEERMSHVRYKRSSRSISHDACIDGCCAATPQHSASLPTAVRTIIRGILSTLGIGPPSRRRRRTQPSPQARATAFVAVQSHVTTSHAYLPASSVLSAA